MNTRASGELSLTNRSGVLILRRRPTCPSDAVPIANYLKGTGDMTQPSQVEARDLDVEPQPNLPLLRKVLDHIDAHPEDWQQGGYAVESQAATCGTAFCIAGHAVNMTEGVVRSEYGDLEPASNRDWAEAGRDALGLSWEQAGGSIGRNGGLFDAGNTRADVQRLADAIAAQAGERL